MRAKREHFKKILIKWVSVDFVKTSFKLAFSCGKGIIWLILLRKKFVILSAPKTGTTSLQAALEPHASIMFRDPSGEKNTNLAKYQRQIRKMFVNLSDGPFETFGIVRHPQDRMGSWYRYRQRDQLKGHRNSTHGISLDAFLTAYMSEDRPHFASVGGQAHFFQTTPKWSAA